MGKSLSKDIINNTTDDFKLCLFILKCMYCILYATNKHVHYMENNSWLKKICFFIQWQLAISSIKVRKFLILCRPDGNCQTSKKRSPVNNNQNCPFPQLAFVHRFDCIPLGSCISRQSCACLLHWENCTGSCIPIATTISNHWSSLVAMVNKQ